MNNVTPSLRVNVFPQTQVGKNILLKGILPNLAGLFMLAAPAEAARLQSWQFQSSQNRLSFTTAGGVQPRAQLLANPTRLAIDLPGTTIGQLPRSQYLGSAIKEIRVGQFESNTARIVVEFADGYTVDPTQVQFNGLSASEWTVQIPTPQRIGTYVPPTVNGGDNRSSTPVATNAQTIVQSINVGEQGIVLNTSGQQPRIEKNFAAEGSWMTISIFGATLSPDFRTPNQLMSGLGISRVQVTPGSGSVPVVRVTLDISDRTQAWDGQVSATGAVLLWPQGGMRPRVSQGGDLSTISAVELTNNGTELVIKADRPLSYSSGWDTPMAYRITIPGAQIGSGVRLPNFSASNGVLAVEQRQDDSETVTLLVKPNPNFLISSNSIYQPNSQQISLQLEPKQSTVVTPVPGNNRDNSSYPRPIPQPRQTTPSPQTRPIQQGRAVVVIDPGHGGNDTGAIGIGGLREIDVVLPISKQVRDILEQNGVQVVMTREYDQEVELEPRTQLANRVNADLFISIHANAIDMTRPDVNGIETYYFQSRSGQLLAQYIHNSVLQTTGAPNRGVREARFYVLRHTQMPAVLVEVGFVTGAQDAQKLADPAYRSVMAEAIARGILQYMQRYL
jgi:N-acetylmuramoyl-L-alanine amidase